MKDDQLSPGSLYISGPYVYSNNSEMVALATPEVVAELKSLNRQFDSSAQGTNWDDVEGMVYGDNHELVAYIPPKLKL